MTGSACTVLQAGLLTAKAMVIDPFEGGAWVSVDPMQRCHGCSASQGCGNALLARRSGKRARRMAIDSTHRLQAGERIIIGLPSPTLLKGALGVYGIPLGGSLLAGLLAERLLSVGHGLVPLAFIAGLAAGVGVARLVRHRHDARYRPIWVETLATPAA
ncbi:MULTISPECIES: SoxR reducing system RseC family protein [Halomonadaceae]|uniref:SoxR reducing system RseC family protein n=1 Tax=Halomonadaceae TaxID=28256 RepID=UPI00159B5123|nr:MULTISPECIES: SoxR reducing system RseC family protein [Halomonas]QJQ94725.1 SoxR reducing system RseC family protein [Halomonas sp. PA5]